MGSMLNPKLVYTTSYFPIRSVLGVRVRNCFLSSQLSVSYSHENISFFGKIKEKSKSQWISCFRIKSRVANPTFFFWEVLVVPVILNRGYHYDEILEQSRPHLAVEYGTTLRHLRVRMNWKNVRFSVLHSVLFRSTLVKLQDTEQRSWSRTLTLGSYRRCSFFVTTPES